MKSGGIFARFFYYGLVSTGPFFVITKGVKMQKVSYMGNGSTTEFTFNFPYFENTNIIVTKNGAPATGYDIVGTSAGSDADIPYTGGKVVFETAPSSIDSITIARNLSLTRIVDYQPTVKINPTTLNQDMNYMMEVLKDRKDELDTLASEYADIANKESTTTLLARIAALSEQITNLGDISTLRQNVTTNGNNITTLDSRTTGLLDYVIASQSPTADNNYTWYRKYKSGWVEQGGIFAGEATYNFPITMADTNYTINTSCKMYTAAAGTTIILYTNETTTGIKLQGRVDGYGNNDVRGCWTIQGFSAA